MYRSAPGAAVAAAVLGYIQAGILILIGLRLLLAADLLGLYLGAWWFVAGGLANLGLAALFITGGVRLQRHIGEGALVGAAVLEFALTGLWLVSLGRYLTSSFFLLIIAVFVALPAVAWFLATRQSVRDWLGELTLATAPAYVVPGYGMPPAFMAVPVIGEKEAAAGILERPEVAHAFEVYGHLLVTGQAPWVEQTQPLAGVHNAIGMVRGSVYAARMLENLQTVSRQSPWHAIGVWQFVKQYGPKPWHRSPLMASFLVALRSVMSDPAAAPLPYRLTAEEADAVRRTEPSDSPLWRLMPEQPQQDAPESDAQAPV